jgi:L-lactate permease
MRVIGPIAAGLVVLVTVLVVFTAYANENSIYSSNAWLEGIFYTLAILAVVHLVGIVVRDDK